MLITEHFRHRRLVYTILVSRTAADLHLARACFPKVEVLSWQGDLAGRLDTEACPPCPSAQDHLMDQHRELASLCHFGSFVGSQTRKFKIQRELSREAVNGVSRGGS